MSYIQVRILNDEIKKRKQIWNNIYCFINNIKRTFNTNDNFSAIFYFIKDIKFKFSISRKSPCLIALLKLKFIENYKFIAPH